MDELSVRSSPTAPEVTAEQLRRLVELGVITLPTCSGLMNSELWLQF
jgi:uncharacterized membrane protein